VIRTVTPGPWAVDNTLSHHWAIINTETGRRKVIGPVRKPRSRSKVNYFDRAYEEASRRNAAIAKAEGGKHE
jgi:hypothetical protein